VIEITLRILFSLLVVLALMWALAKVARRPLAGRAAGPMAVLARQQLSRNASVAVVKVAGRTLVLGVTDQQVSLLGEADLAAPDDRPRGEAVRRESVVDQIDAGAVGAGGSPDPTHAPHALPTGPPNGRLAGSVLSLRTWTQTLNLLRERTVRTP
jgi:flagellar protein FliO/FliZ